MNDTTGQREGELPLHGVGDRLRLAREQAGMTVEQLAAETRIPQRHLLVIEAGDFDALPARTYATGFARTYAKAVGLNPAAIVADVRAELAMTGGADRARTATFEPGDPARVPSRTLALVSLAALVLLLVGGGMFYWRVLAPGSGPPSLLDEQKASAPARTAPAAAAAAAAAAPVGGEVAFTALDDRVWIKFYDDTGTQLMQKEMAKGERYVVPADASGPQAWTGRPEAFAITVGGKPVAPLADQQSTVKDVPVSAAALLARNAPGASPDVASPTATRPVATRADGPATAPRTPAPPPAASGTGSVPAAGPGN